jgi:chitinase
MAKLKWAVKTIVMVVVALLMTLPSAKVKAADNGIIIGYATGWLNSEFPLAKCDYVIVEYLYPTSPTDMTLNLATSTTSDTKAHTLITAIHAAGSKALMDIYTPWNVSGYNDVFGDAGLEAQLISNILSMMEHYDLDGIDFDWESDVQSNWSATAFGNFIADLYAAMPTGKKYITMSTPANKAVVNAATVASYMTAIHPMVYDLSVTWYGSYTQWTTALTYWSGTVGVAKSKICGGINTYWRGGTTYPDNWVAWKHVLAGYNPVAGYYNTIPTNEDNSVPAASYQWGYLTGSGYNLDYQKVEYVIDNDYGGVMLYSLNGDSFWTTGSIINLMDIMLHTADPEPTPTPTPTITPTPTMVPTSTPTPTPAPTPRQTPNPAELPTAVETGDSLIKDVAPIGLAVTTALRGIWKTANGDGAGHIVFGLLGSVVVYIIAQMLVSAFIG